MGSPSRTIVHNDRSRTSTNVEIRREDYRSLQAYAWVRSSFNIREVIDIKALQPGKPTLRTRAVDVPREKNYDAMPANDPASWLKRFDVQSWICLVAYAGTERIGGAIVVTEPKAAAQLGGRSGVAVLWDLRVAPAWRRRGVGRALLTAAEDAVRTAGNRVVDVETQDINLAACRLYNECGYALVAVIPEAYADAPHETKLLWSKELI